MELARLELLQKAASKLDGSASYLREAVACFVEGTTATADASALRDQMIDTLTAPEIDTTKVTQLASRGDDIRSQFVIAAGAYYRHAFLDSVGDKRKQQLLDGSDWAALGKLGSIALLQGGQFASLRGDLAEVGTLMQVDEADLRRSVKIGSHTPGPVIGPSAEARLEQIEVRAREMLATWRETLLDNLADPELAEQIALLSAAQRSLIEDFQAKRTIPDPVTDEFVAAVDQVFRRFDVRKIARVEFLERLFPGEAAASPSELRERFDDYLNEPHHGRQRRQDPAGPRG